MLIIDKATKKSSILQQHNTYFQTMIKAVVDVEREIMAIDAELHADLESLLLEQGSKQENLWGINLYLNKEVMERIEYTALINIRPSSGNRGMEIQDTALRDKINSLVEKLILE
jgi:hypothetical protein